MDPRVKLLKEFSQAFIPGTVKVETEQFGFPFLEELLSDGVELEYGELTPSRLLHKYKLVNVPEHRMNELLGAHLGKTCNLCRYFGAEANDAFCFNLDNNRKTDNTRVIPEMELAVRMLRDCLRNLEFEPLIVASGRGYHVWCRLEQAADNNLLHGFMLRAAVQALMAFQGKGYDHNLIKFSFYPDLRVHDLVSLRLFGSDHARNKAFSRVFTPEGLLSEAASWNYFEDFMENKKVSATKFAAACEALGALETPAQN